MRQGRATEAGSLTACKSGCRVKLPAAYRCLFTVSPTETPSNKKISLILSRPPILYLHPPHYTALTPFPSSHQPLSLCISLLSLSRSLTLISTHIQIFRAEQHTSKCRRTQTHICPRCGAPSPRPRSGSCLEATSDGVSFF